MESERRPGKSRNVDVERECRRGKQTSPRTSNVRVDTKVDVKTQVDVHKRRRENVILTQTARHTAEPGFHVDIQYSADSIGPAHHARFAVDYVIDSIPNWLQEHEGWRCVALARAILLRLWTARKSSHTDSRRVRVRQEEGLFRP